MLRTRVTANSRAPTAWHRLVVVVPCAFAGRGGADKGGHRLDRFDRDQAQDRRAAGGEDDDRRLAHGARGREHGRGDDAGQGSGEDHTRHDPRLRRAEPVRALTEAGGTARIASSEIEATVGRTMMPIADPGGEREEIGALVASRLRNSGFMNGTLKNPNTTVGIPARISRNGFTHLANPGARVLAEIERRSKPDRDRRTTIPTASHERADHDRQTPKLAGSKAESIPCRRKSPRDLLEEPEGRADQGDHDHHRDQHRQRRAGAENTTITFSP